MDTAPTRAASNRAALALMGAGLLVGLLAGLVVFIGAPQWAPAPAGAAATPAPAPVVGAPAPDFTLNELGGGQVTLSSFNGQVVLINFWATWCGPCELEMPGIEAQYQAVKDQGFTVLAVNLDEPDTLVSDFVTRLGLSFPILLDPGATVNDLYRVRGYPTTYIVDREGVIVQVHVGYMNEGQLTGYLAKLGLAG